MKGAQSKTSKRLRAQIKRAIYRFSFLSAMQKRAVSGL
jgi:hypothetical protein